MGNHHTADDIDIVEVAGKVMVVGIILLFFVVIFFCCLHLYFKWFYQQQTTTNNIMSRRRRRRRMDFAGGHLSQEMVVVSSESSGVGLEAWVLKSIPVVTVDEGADDEELMECAVCLCGVREGEKARILPKCNHGFHVDCIDMWFHSHATCPLCRNPISISVSSISSISIPSIPIPIQDQQHLPTTTTTTTTNHHLLLTCREAEAEEPAVVIDIIPVTQSRN